MGEGERKEEGKGECRGFELFLDLESIQNNIVVLNEGALGLAGTCACLGVCAEIVWKCRE